jgi:prolyl oligopeptidase
LPNGERRFHHKLYFHQSGDDWRSDEMVFGESLRREQTPYPIISADGRYLAVLAQDLSGEAPRSELYLLDREHSQRGFVRVVHGLDVFIQAAFHRDNLYIRTNHEAPLGKLVAIKLPAREGFNATTLIPEGSHLLRHWMTVANHLFVETVEDVVSRLRVYDLDGEFIKEIELPGIGCIDAFSAEPESNELLFSFSSFLIPPATYRVNLDTLTYDFLDRPQIPFKPEAFAVQQVWFESPDRTRIPMFLIHRKDIERDGKNPAVVHGYGGFGVSFLPKFTAHVIPFLEHGGIYAVVNARGGGEFGEEWHQAGMRANKQNTFDDFIAAGEWLISQGYTQPSKLGCFGWSNGGLSINAVAVQRPDLWKAVVAGAPVTDMARFHLAHGGAHWIADYGSPDDPADLNTLMRYSPYHTLPETIAAPAILTIAPGNDDRVAPWHSYKMHSAWQAANVSSNAILLRGVDQAGHRGSPAASRAIDLYTDIWSFFFTQLGIS